MVDSNEEKVLALLHDTIEDSDTTIEDIACIFGEDMAVWVDMLTKKDEVPHMHYIEKISWSKTCSKVKICDMLHNLTRSPSGKQKQRYSMSYKLLKLEPKKTTSENIFFWMRTFGDNPFFSYNLFKKGFR